MEVTISIFVKDEHKGIRKVTTPCMIGRSKEADFTIGHPAISRKHCELFEEDGYLKVRDNASLNGVGVNGELITEPVILMPNSFFSISDIKFQVDYAAPKQENSLFVIDDDDETGEIDDIVDLALLDGSPPLKPTFGPDVLPPMPGKSPDGIWRPGK